MNVKIRVIEPYWDVQLHPKADDPNKVLPAGFEWVVAKERADYF